MLPLCSSTIFLTMARPSPVPLALVVTYGSNARARMSGGKPVPLSCTASRAPPASRWVRITMRGRLDLRHRLFRILQQVVDYLPQSRLIALDLRQRLVQLQHDAAPVRFVQRKYFAHQPVEVEGFEADLRNACVLAEGVDHALELRYLRHDGLGGAASASRRPAG